MNAQGVLLEQPEPVARAARDDEPADKSALKRKASLAKKRAAQDLARALRCPVCAAAGIVNHPPMQRPAAANAGTGTDTARAVGTGPGPMAAVFGENCDAGRAAPPRLTAGQARLLRRAWDYLAVRGPGGDPDSRLLALVCLLRAARSGKANLVAQDVTGLRVTDPRATVAALTAGGWLVTDPETVLAADPTAPAACALPEFTDSPNPWGIGKDTRARASGWTSRVLAHKLLRRRPNLVRVTALYLTAHAAPDGAIEFTPAHLVAACALHGKPDLVTAIRTLLELGWLADCRPTGSGTLHARLADAVLALAASPEPPSRQAPQPRTSTPGSDTGSDTACATVQQVPAAVEAEHLVAGREPELARWVETFRAEHGHGPSWATIGVAQGWPDKGGRAHAVRNAALLRLYSHGWLAGLHTPYGMRPGPRYRDLRERDEQGQPNP